MNGKHFSFLKGAIVGILFALVLSGGLFAYASEQVKILINGQETSTDVPAQIIDGRTMIPLRTIGEGIGASVEWNSSTNTATITMPETYSAGEAEQYENWLNKFFEQNTNISQLTDPQRLTVIDRLITEAASIRAPKDNTESFSNIIKSTLNHREAIVLYIRSAEAEQAGHYEAAAYLEQEADKLLDQATKYLNAAQKIAPSVQQTVIEIPVIQQQPQVQQPAPTIQAPVVQTPAVQTPAVQEKPSPAPAAPVNIAPVSSPPQSSTVYITRTGAKYHRDGCRYLSRSRIPISLSNAKAQGYGACSVCNPPR
jgi:hypothetical protein